MKQVLSGIALVAVIAVTAPVGAQSTMSPSSPGSPSGSAPTASGSAGASLGVPSAPVPDRTVRKVGAAMKQVVQIRQHYSTKVRSAATPAEKQALIKQAHSEMLGAITGQGLTVATYEQVIHAAQTDPQLRQRVLKAAGAPDQ